MNFLEKLEYMMKNKGLNNNTLSKACGIPYTTIDGWYKKGYEGLKLTTLRKLASYFETDLNFWVEDENLTILAETKQPAANEGDELWKIISKSEEKVALMEWIATLNPEQLERVEKLLDAALLLPKE